MHFQGILLVCTKCTNFVQFAYILNFLDPRKSPSLITKPWFEAKNVLKNEAWSMCL